MFTTSPQLHGLVVGSLVADSLALGPHWIYDPASIAAKYSAPLQLQPPGTAYHPGKSAGHYSHLGDQTLLLLKSIQATGGEFDPQHYMTAWRQFWETPGQQSYKDKATKTVFENLARGTELLLSGALSAEMAGPARCAPVLASGLAKGASEKELLALAQSQTQLTHRSSEAVDTAAFYARLLMNFSAGLDLETALDAAEGDSSQFVRDLGLKAQSPRVDSMSTSEAVVWLGQSCDLTAALPASLLILRRHGGNYEEAMTENVLAGGDSAARGLFLGGLLGYLHGISAVPERWRTGVKDLAGL
jgi:ADP-ribosylglycohydrolase